MYKQYFDANIYAFNTVYGTLSWFRNIVSRGVWYSVYIILSSVVEIMN